VWAGRDVMGRRCRGQRGFGAWKGMCEFGLADSCSRGCRVRFSPARLAMSLEEEEQGRIRVMTYEHKVFGANSLLSSEKEVARWLTPH
jgi:hypothetical protein